jgi:hypothetical protein
MRRFRPIDRDTDYLLPPSIQDWIPEAHLARYVVDVVDGLDLSELKRACTRGVRSCIDTSARSA